MPVILQLSRALHTSTLKRVVLSGDNSAARWLLTDGSKDRVSGVNEQKLFVGCEAVECCEAEVHANKDVENSIIFVHPTCGPTQPGDIDGPTRIKTYEVLQEEPEYKKWAGDNFRWSYLPYSMKMAGPREAIQHMIIRKNFGATHFIIGRDMAGTNAVGN